MVLTTEQLNHLDNKCKLAGYPKSHFFTVAFEHQVGGRTDLAIAAFKRGAKEVSCVASMFCYAELQQRRGNVHLALSYYIEAAIRGHIASMIELIRFFQETKPAVAFALSVFWEKMMTELGDTTFTEERRKERKKKVLNVCYICEKENSEVVTLNQCAICKYYSYCGKECQTNHWKEYKHMNECHHVILLRKYCKPSYVIEIRQAIIGGQDPKEIHTLQRLRMKLGLNRPKEEYEELMLRLNIDAENNNNYNNITKSGTQVKVKGLVNASEHNGKIGIVTNSKVCTSSIRGEEHHRVGVKLSDDNGSTVVVAIKLKNLDTNHPNPHAYLIGRKDGTIHIGSTPNAM